MTVHSTRRIVCSALGRTGRPSGSPPEIDGWPAGISSCGIPPARRTLNSTTSSPGWKRIGELRNSRALEVDLQNVGDRGIGGEIHEVEVSLGIRIHLQSLHVSLLGTEDERDRSSGRDRVRMIRCVDAPGDRCGESGSRFRRRQGR